MKTTKLSAILLGAIALSAASTSCMKNDPDDSRYVPYDITSLINYTADGERVVSNDSVNMVVKYYIKDNTTSGEAELSIGSIRTAEGITYKSVTMPNLPWTFETSTGWLKIGVSQANNTSQGTIPPFTNLTCNIMDRYVEVGNTNLFYPLLKVTYTLLGNQYFVMPRGVVNTGETVVTDRATGEIYTPGKNEMPIYILSFDSKKGLAKIAIYGAKFAAKMPAMNMRFEGIPFTMNNRGQFVLERKEALTPLVVKDVLNHESTGTPYEQFPISEISCETDAANNMILVFTCTMAGKNPAGEDVTVEYVTRVTCTTPKIVAAQ